MNSMLRFLVSPVFALLLTASALRAADSDYGMAAGSVALPEGLSAADVQRVILEAAIGRNWTIAGKDDGKVVVKLDQEKWSSQLTLVYSTRDVQIYSRSTRNGKPKLPAAWIRYLKEDIVKKANLLVLTRS